MGGSGRDQTIRQPLRNFAVQGSRKWLVSRRVWGQGKGGVLLKIGRSYMFLC